MSKSHEFRTWYSVTTGITVTDNDTGQPLDGVTIEGTWGGGYVSTVSGTTGGNGMVIFTSEWVGRGATITFTINKVKIGDKEYNFTGNAISSIRI